jgi:hypothetical protein
LVIGVVLLEAVVLGANNLSFSPTEAQAVDLPDLVVSKTVLNTIGPYFAGQGLEYFLTVSNIGGPLDPGTVVRVMDRLPAGARFIQSGCLYNPSNPPDVVCDLPIGSGGYVVSITVALPTRLPGNRIVTNQAEVNPQRTIRESNYFNNRSQLSLPVLPAPAP